MSNSFILSFSKGKNNNINLNIIFHYAAILKFIKETKVCNSRTKYYKNNSKKLGKNKIITRNTKGLRSEIKTTNSQYKTF
jgi:hypothetical protein